MHSHSCPNHVSVGLLQHAVHGAAAEEYSEVAARAECNGTESLATYNTAVA